MAAQANIALNTKVYTPRGKINGDVAQWGLIGDATFGGASSFVTESVRGPTQDGNYRVHWKLDVPKAAASDSTCACTGELLSRGICDINVQVPANFTTAERQDLVDRAQAMVALAIFDSSVALLEPSW